MTIEEIFNRNEISVRTYNVCIDNKLFTLSDLKKYFYANKSFKGLRNCGTKTNRELIEICTKNNVDTDHKKEENNQKGKPFENTVSELSRVQREVINSFIVVNTNSLSTRNRNVILSLLEENLKVKNFIEKILNKESLNFSNLKNVGSRSVDELNIYVSLIKEFLLDVSQTKDSKKLSRLKNIFFIQRTFEISNVPNEVLESESIFQIINFLLNQNAFFDNTQTAIVKKALKLFNNQNELTLDEIAEEVDLSRERVRQIRKYCLDNLFNNLLFISNFNDDLFQKYSIDVESMSIEITTNILAKINQSNKTNFSREFTTYILSAYLKDSFAIVGNYEDVLQPKYFNARNRHNWNNFFLVQKELASEIDFNSLTNDISNRINDRIEESYSFNFKSYISKFLTNKNVDILDLLFPICEKIINEEFEVYLDLDENINFKRNTTRQAHEYAFEALEHLGKPSKVKEIFEKVIELHPNYDTEEAKIRVSMKRKNGFVPIGRKSVFGLKKWESELDNFKGGTIKDVIIDFLKTQKEPTHIAKVLEHLEKFRQEKDERSVITNLKVDPMKRFLIFNQGFIGLQEYKNEYNDKFKKLPVQLGKTIIGKHKKGYSINDIQTFLLNSFNLTFEESKLILDNLKYFNENKRN